MAFVGRYERMNAERAYELGMISQIVDPPEQLREEAQAAGRDDRQELAGGDARDQEGAVGRARARASPTAAAPGRRSWCRCGATPTRPKARSRSPRSASRAGPRDVTPMNLADVLDPRDDDATTVAVYTTTEEITRAELRARAEALTALLRERGLQPGQAVGVMLPNGPDIVAALFGIWFAGGVYVPLNPRLSADELAHVIAEDRPAAILTLPGDAARIVDVPVVLATGGGTWDAPGPARRRRTVVARGRRRDLVHLGHDRTAQAGAARARQRARSHRRCARHAARRRDDRSADAPKRAPMPNLIPTSLSLWAGIYNVIFAFRAGAAVIIMDRFDTQAFAGFVERFQLRSTVLPPAAMTMLADDESITSLAPLKYVRSITAPLSPLQARRFRDRFGVFVLNGWGQTEIGGEIVGWSAQDAKEFGDTHLGAVGRAHENVQLRISERSG